MKRDRAALFVAYVLLVAITAWSARSTSDGIDRVEDHVCNTAAANALLILASIGEDDIVTTLEGQALIEAVQAIGDECDLDLPPFQIPPMQLEPAESTPGGS